MRISTPTRRVPSAPSASDVPGHPVNPPPRTVTNSRRLRWVHHLTLPLGGVVALARRRRSSRQKPYLPTGCELRPNARPPTFLGRWHARQLRLLIAPGKTNVGLFQSMMPADGTLSARSHARISASPALRAATQNLAKFTGTPYPPIGGPRHDAGAHGRGPLWVKMRKPRSEHMLAGLSSIADIARRTWHGRKVPCVDVSELARTFFPPAGWSGQPCVRPHMRAPATNRLRR